MNEMNSILFLNERKHILKSNIQLFFKFVGSKFDSSYIQSFADDSKRCELWLSLKKGTIKGPKMFDTPRPNLCVLFHRTDVSPSLSFSSSSWYEILYKPNYLLPKGEPVKIKARGSIMV